MGFIPPSRTLLLTIHFGFIPSVYSKPVPKLETMEDPKASSIMAPFHGGYGEVLKWATIILIKQHVKIVQLTEAAEILPGDVEGKWGLVLESDIKLELQR